MKPIYSRVQITTITLISKWKTSVHSMLKLSQNLVHVDTLHLNI